MSKLLIDCSHGAAGDMITAALLELMPDRDEALRGLNNLGLPGVVFKAEARDSYGAAGTHLHVLVHDMEEGAHDHHHHEDGSGLHTHGEEHHVHTHHSHHHMTLKDVRQIVSALHVSENVKQQVYRVYGIIAEAESRAHECTVEEVHFHEVGAMDAIADVTAACYLMERISPEEVLADTMQTGSGTVICAHGELPVPAPATAFILEEMPWCHGEGMGERCTPTGAALVRHFTDRYLTDEETEALLGKCPAEHYREGRGIGGKDFGEANFLGIVSFFQ